MSVSLYYTAKREVPLSDREKAACENVADQYIREYPLGDMYEPFCVYDMSNPTEEHVIFEGATKLPLDEGEEHCTEVLDYWADCLQEIINLLPGAQWDIHIDDADVTQHFDFPD